MFQSGEGIDFVIEVQQDLPQPNDDGPSRKRSKKIGQAGKGTRQQQQQNVQTYTKECQESRIIIKDSSTTAVRHMIHYMYTGKIPDEYDKLADAAPLLAIAHKYQIKPLIDFNEWIMVETLTLENVFERLKFAELLQTEKLKTHCANIIRHNLGVLKQGPEWTELKQNYPELVHILRR